MLEIFIPYALLIFAGAFAGFFSGLISIGGGVIIVPILYYIWTGSVWSNGASPDFVLHSAIGTSLATITITQARSAFGHWQRGSFDFSLWRKWSVPIVVGALAGGLIATSVNGKLLAYIFSAILFFVAVMIIYRSNLEEDEKPEKLSPKGGFVYPVAVTSGGLSAIAGIGGGTLNVSSLVLLFGMNIRSAIGLSAGLGVLIGACGSLVFALNSTAEGSAPYMLGYIHLPAAGVIMLFSFLTSPLGVALSHRMKQKKLQVIFSVLLMAAALHMFYEGWIL